MAARSRDSLHLSQQLNNEWQRSGINFRIMLVGESGLGKSTFTRALLRPYVPDDMLHGDSHPTTLRGRTTEITEIVHKVDNDGFPVEITVIDCPGFGDQTDTTPWINSIIDYVRQRFEDHYNLLSAPPAADGSHVGLQRDGLIHVCLYFIAAHRLKGVDLEFMQRLEPHVNLVPIIAKSDTMTLAERDAFRRLILSELKASGVKIFQLIDSPVASTPSGAPATPLANGAAEAAAAVEEPTLDSAAPGALAGPTPARALSRSTTQPPPFAVCSSEDGTRIYPWGTCCVEDPSHSDLSTLRSMLFASSMVAAKRKTLELYEASYASGRRGDEAARAARQAAALARERFLGRSVMLLMRSSALACAVTGVLSVVRPAWVAAGRATIDSILSNPNRLAVAAVDALVSAANRARQLLGHLGLPRLLRLTKEA